MVVLGAQVKTKIYRISGSGSDYSFCEFQCPELEKKFSIEVPENIIKNILIDDDILEEYHYTGLINDEIYEDILRGCYSQIAWFVATKKDNEQWICNRIKFKENHLIGRLPVKFDLYKRKLAMGIYAVFYILLIMWLVNKVL